MALITAFIQIRTSEAVATEHIATKMKMQQKVKVLDPYVIRISPKSVSPPSRTDLAPSSSPFHKDNDVKASKSCLEHLSHSISRYRRHRRDEKRSSTSSRSAKLNESPFDLAPNFHSTHNRSQRSQQSENHRPNVQRPVNNRLHNTLDYHTCSPAGTSP